MLAYSSFVTFISGDTQVPLTHLYLYCNHCSFLNMFGDPTRVTSIMIANTSGLWEVLLFLENLSFYKTLVIWWYRMVIKDQKVHAVKAESHSLLIIFNLEVRDPTLFFFFLQTWEALYVHHKKIKFISEYWKPKSFTPHFINIQPAREQWQQIWSSFCTKTRMVLRQECQPECTMVMRNFCRSNCGVSEEHGFFFFPSQPLFQLNLEFCNRILSLASHVHSHSAP